MKVNKPHIGLRTIKTALAAVIAMCIVSFYGSSNAKYMFAAMGAMQVTQKTIKESFDSCRLQFLGVSFGAIIGVILLYTPIPDILAAGIGVVLLITVYNIFNIKFSPIMPCVVIVSICTIQSSQPLTYAMGRLWDTAIGLMTGLMINISIYPYDNIGKLHEISEKLDDEILIFIKNTFDKNGEEATVINAKKLVNDLANQLTIFSNQWILFRLRNHVEDYHLYQELDEKVQTLIAHMKAIHYMKHLGNLNEENKNSLLKYGITIEDKETDNIEEYNITTNYHVKRLLIIHQRILDILKQIHLK